MKALTSLLALPLPLCGANEMGVYYSVYNTLTATVFIISCCQVQAVHPPTHTHTPQYDDITLGYHLISTAISTSKHTTQCFVCSFPTLRKDTLSTDELGRKEEKGTARILNKGSFCGKHWRALLEGALPCTPNATVKDQRWLR